MDCEKLASLLDDSVPQTHYYKIVSSTNTVACDFAERGEEGVFIAAEQTAGRGRNGRSFYSPVGCGLYLSFALFPGFDAADAFRLTTTAAVAASETLELFSGREARIKWVNDVLIADRKVCGILTEGKIVEGKLAYAVVGIGINLFSPPDGFPEEIADKAGCVFTARKDCLEALTADLINRFYRLLDEDVFERYKERSIIVGRKITVRRGETAEEGDALALDERCRLLVRYAKDGRLEYLESGEASIEGLY